MTPLCRSVFPSQEAQTQGGDSPLVQREMTSSSEPTNQPPSKIVVEELPLPTANAANTLVSSSLKYLLSPSLYFLPKSIFAFIIVSLWCSVLLTPDHKRVVPRLPQSGDPDSEAT